MTSRVQRGAAGSGRRFSRTDFSRTMRIPGTRTSGAVSDAQHLRCGDDPQPVLPAGMLVVRQELQADTGSLQIILATS